jgi:ribosomal subunit interface protein
MQPVKIVIRNMPNSPALENNIRKKSAKLEQFYDHINSLQVVIRILQKHKHSGKLYCVRMDMTVPSKKLVVNKQTDEDVYVAIRNSFNAMLRQLETYVRKRRGEVKHHSNAESFSDENVA